MLDRLHDLAMDLWWTTQPDADGLWSDLDRELWDAVHHNPVALLAEAAPDRAPDGWQDRAQDLLTRWQAAKTRPLAPDSPRIAYFCMEFALHECLPIYSGGLGVLAGDHVRSADALGLDLVAVGLYYSRGYFQQVIHDGQQVAAYPFNDPARLPVRPVLDPQGQQLEVHIPHSRHQFRARLWQVQVGRVRLFLLDTDYDANALDYRVLTRNLYGGTAETRLSQEILLGIGGVRALQALGIERDVFHMNEGHAAPLVWELWAQALQAPGITAEQAWQQARQRCVFTTHTPLPSGHDRFPWSQVDAAVVGYREALGLPQGAFMDRGRGQPGDLHEPLCMTILALRGSRSANGVSRLNGQVSRQLWRDLDAPIGHVTNGVHPTVWLGAEIARLFDSHLPGWQDHFEDPDFWERARDIPAETWDRARGVQRRRLVDGARWRVGRPVLDRSRLTIGFARRFAGYKRSSLLFTDLDRLIAILDHGVQIVFAGKAHPADALAQAQVAEVVRWTQRPNLRGRVVFLPDYDLALGRLLTQGADVWLNTPRRPREACGTSGQKAAINGGLNLSVLDGWWPEAWDGTNGWAIGDEREWQDTETQDQADAESLYQQLEQAVLPTWASPQRWGAMVGAAVATCMPRFNTHRMVRDYLDLLYRPEIAPRLVAGDGSGLAAPAPR